MFPTCVTRLDDVRLESVCYLNFRYIVFKDEDQISNYIAHYMDCSDEQAYDGIWQKSYKKQGVTFALNSNCSK